MYKDSYFCHQEQLLAVMKLILLVPVHQLSMCMIMDQMITLKEMQTQ